MMLLLFALGLISVVHAIEPTKPDPGHPCAPGENGTEPGIKYYSDKSRGQPYPFFYRGCGGDDNRYDAAWEIIQQNYDYTPCPGFEDDNGNCGNGDRSINRFSPEAMTCEKGSFCFTQGMFNVCCSEENRKKDEEDQRGAKCPTGSKVQRDPLFLTLPLLGRRCADNFCQKGATCVEGHFRAYCCIN